MRLEDVGPIALIRQRKEVCDPRQHDSRVGRMKKVSIWAILDQTMTCTDREGIREKAVECLEGPSS